MTTAGRLIVAAVVGLLAVPVGLSLADAGSESAKSPRPMSAEEVSEFQAADSASTGDSARDQQIEAIVADGGSWAQVPDAPPTPEQVPSGCEDKEPSRDVHCAIAQAQLDSDIGSGVYEQSALEAELVRKGYLVADSK